MKRSYFGRVLGLAAAACALLTGAGVTSAQPVNMVMVPAGDVGNAPDPATGSLYGSVNYAYNIGKYDVTAGQYVAFLNAVAKTDTYGLYDSLMATAGFGQVITQAGASGSYTYAVTTNGNFPVTWVSWGDAARFCNWLTNNQPSGAEGNGTTETGLYTLNGATTNAQLMAITRNTGAGYAIPTENEWYKAAYYKGGGTNAGYWEYPTQSNTAPDNSLALAGTEANDANYYINNYTDPMHYLTAVGTFAASPSAYGTFDQGGDVWQWNEANGDGWFRGLRGGSFDGYDGSLESGDRNNVSPTSINGDFGFRVSQVPEPTSLGLLGLGVIGILTRRRGAGR